MNVGEDLEVEFSGNNTNGLVLEVSGLTVLHDQGARIVEDASFTLRRGQTLGLVGESGSGKSLTALGLIGLLPNGLRRTGRIELLGQDLVGLADRQLDAIRGSHMAMVFQDPMSGLNPVRTIGSALTEAARRYRRCSRTEAKGLVIDGLAAVGIPSPAERLAVYPHQLSGGLRQRVMIALALINNPDMIIADEVTTALDTTVQAQIIALLKEQTREAALLLITHDLGVASELCDRIAVMYSGHIVEEGPVAELLTHPHHPYTVALLAAAPNFDRSRQLVGIPGAPPSPFHRPTGCPYHPRCPNAIPICTTDRPELVSQGSTRLACWNPCD